MAPPVPPSNKAWPMTVLLLRLLTFKCLLVSLIVLATDSFSYVDANSSSGKSSFRFNKIYAYRYVLSVAVIGCAYTLAWIPFAVYHVAHGKPVSVGLPQLNHYTDVILVLVLATGIGAGFGLTLDVKRFFNGLPDALRETYGLVLPDDAFSKVHKFLDKAYISAGFLLAGVVPMVVLVIGSSLALPEKS